MWLTACGGGEQPGTGGGGANGDGGAGLVGAGGDGEGGLSFGGEGGGTTTTDPCAAKTCDPDQHCVSEGGAATCENNTCDMLNCGATEICDKGPNGGAICKDIACSDDLQCPEAQFCNGTICVDDVCGPGALSCAGADLEVCAPNGSGLVTKATCGSEAYFTSVCADSGVAQVGCTCEDDWDCPAHMECDVGVCVGTGQAPQCSLPPAPFVEALPTQEIHWGGISKEKKEAVNAPFPDASQVSATPLVANLDDDNGDGLINERDFPEIIFMTYCNTKITADGVVRAIHGGGPNKGKDFFATCGNTVWHEGEPLATCACTDATGNSTASPAVGDLDNDGVPEIIVPNETSGFTILSNTGEKITESLPSVWTGYTNPAIAIANVDEAGFAEIVVGRHVFTLAHDPGGKLVVLDHFEGSAMHGIQSQGPVSCIANIAGDSRVEIIGGTSAYRMPIPPAGVEKRADCPMGAMDNFCLGKLDLVWDTTTLADGSAIPTAQRDGFCAVADILGANEAAAPGPANPLDGHAEVILINDGYLLVLNGEKGNVVRYISLGVGNNGGAPNVDDFDGDGFPEVGSAFGAAYVLSDLQDPTVACPAWTEPFTDDVPGLGNNLPRMPGGACMDDMQCAAGAFCDKTTDTCACLHNSWRRVTEDNSSQVTSSSVFDFNGDGAAEVVYNDECYFRIYDGRAGDVVFKQHSTSRTRIENPAIADVDNDGNVEIVFPSNNDSNACESNPDAPNGIDVWGDSSDSWVSGRRIWNQHAYHVTNVTEGGQIPVREAESHKSYHGRVYNTFRSNPRSYNVAPDLAVTGVQISSPGVLCGALSDKLTITSKIENLGDLRVGPGVKVSYYGIWGGEKVALYADASASPPVPLTTTLVASLEPKDAILVSAAYDSAQNGAGLPDQIEVIIDEIDSEKECHEDNNAKTIPVAPSMALADLVVKIDAVDDGACPTPTVDATVTNQGAAPASDVLVRFFAGDPSAGGAQIGSVVVAGTLAASGGSKGFTVTMDSFPSDLSILIYAVVDPEDQIPECNDGNNSAAAAQKIVCQQVN